jgi:transposase InsO family protein
VAEAFFSSVKKERTKKPMYQSLAIALADIIDRIDTCDNRTRRHGFLGESALSSLRPRTCVVDVA